MHTLGSIILQRLAIILSLASIVPAAARADEPKPEARVARERLDRFADGQMPACAEARSRLLHSRRSAAAAGQYRQRLTRVMTDIQEFYAGEMHVTGWDRKTIRFDRDSQGLAVFHEVHGRRRRPITSKIGDPGKATSFNARPSRSWPRRASIPIRRPSSTSAICGRKRTATSPASAPITAAATSAAAGPGSLMPRSSTPHD